MLGVCRPWPVVGPFAARGLSLNVGELEPFVKDSAAVETGPAAGGFGVIVGDKRTPATRTSPQEYHRPASPGNVIRQP